MQPTGPQLERLQQALLSAYPRLEHVRSMVRIHLDADLDAIVPLYGQNQTDTLFALIEHYAAQPGGMHRLIQAARAGNPGNQLLAAVAAEFLAIDFDPKPIRKQRGEILWGNVPPKPAAPLLGRDGLLSDLLARLTAGHSPALSTDGLPGVGKTALAVALAHDERVRQVLPDGVLWGGLGVNPDVVTVQNQWAAALGVELADEPDVHRRLELLSRVLGDRHVLVVIDDAWDIEAAQALRLSSPHAVHLLTTRDRMIARAFAGAGQQVHVPELEAVPAFELLERLAPEACATDAEAARALVQTVGELPLAIEVLGGYLGGHDLTVFPDLAGEAFAAMSDAKQRLALAIERLGGQPGKKETLEAVIRMSVDALPLEASVAFWSLGAFAPKPATFDRAAAQAVTLAEASTLALLVGRNLVEAADGLLAVHQVVHDVMAGAVPGAAVKRHRDHYLDLVNENREDWQRIEAVYDQVRYAWERLVESEKPSPLQLEFVWRLSTYHERRGIWQDELTWCTQALAYAQAEALVSEQALLLDRIGSVHSALGDGRRALDYFEQALPLHRQAGAKEGETTTLNNMGLAFLALGESAEAGTHFEQAFDLSQQVDDPGGRAAFLNNLGSLYDEAGDWSAALQHYEQSLELYVRAGDRSGGLIALNNIGHILWNDKRFDEAGAIQRQIVALAHEIGDVKSEAAGHSNLAAVLVRQGRMEKALYHARQSIELLEQHRLPQDRTGQTLAQKRAFLARLSGATPAPPIGERTSVKKLCALVIMARQGDEELGSLLTAKLQQMTASEHLHIAQRRFLILLMEILAGNDHPDLNELTPDLHAAIQTVLASLTEADDN